MRKTMNQVTVEGLLYQHTLELKVSGENSKNPGTEYITGTVEIATDDKLTNIIPVHYTYVTATTSKGNPNKNYNVLKNIISGAYKNVMADGAAAATKFKINSAIGLNEFFSDRSGTEELVSVKRNEGGFIEVVNALNEDEKARCAFKCDMIITNVREVEADEEKGTPEKAIVKGAIFDFRNALLPVEFTALNPIAIDYFVGLGASEREPFFTNVWGREISEVVVTKKVEESAFGDDYVREYTNTRKDFVLTGALREPYGFDEEGSILASEFREAIANREVYIATLKKRNEEYKNSKNQNFEAPAVNSDTDFKF